MTDQLQTGEDPVEEPALLPRNEKRASVMRESLPLPRFETWAIHLSMLLVGGTGLVYSWMAYLAVPADPYAVVRHPWQPAVQHLHVVVAPLLVFVTGMIWRRHVWSSWRLGIRARRRSGVGLALSLVPMMASGYLLQVAVESFWRTTWGWIHLVSSLLWTLGYLTHQFLGPKPRKNGS